MPEGGTPEARRQAQEHAIGFDVGMSTMKAKILEFAYEVRTRAIADHVDACGAIDEFIRRIKEDANLEILRDLEKLTEGGS